MWGNRVTIINRTAKPIQFMFDGQIYTLVPGENHGYYESLAGFAKSKFPIMGTEDPYNPNTFDCLIGIREWGDPCEPIEQSDSIERLDRSQLMDEKARKNSKVIGAKGGAYRPMVGDAPARNHTEFAGGEGT